MYKICSTTVQFYGSFLGRFFGMQFTFQESGMNSMLIGPKWRDKARKWRAQQWGDNY